MQRIENLVTAAVLDGLNALYGQKAGKELVQLQKTRREFEGDITLVVFPLLRLSRKTPEDTARELGDFLVEHHHEIRRYNVIKGFLNLVIWDGYYLKFLNTLAGQEDYGIRNTDDAVEKIMVEYSSPNTNKPLHLGHIRNNLLGFSICNILQATGKKVVKTNLVNDRGIHICKSMLAWMKFGNGEIPVPDELKEHTGDHLVGKYYVRFDQEYKQQVANLIEKGLPREEAERQAPLMKEAQDMLRKWEAGDPSVMDLWEKMNSWVYAGFDETYRNLGVAFDKVYYESQTWQQGKKTVLEGLEKSIFIRHEDGSVWADLRDEGLDEKVLLRSDGTSVYITQDIGTAELRQEDYAPDRMVYVVGNEQNYHFKVLAIILDKLGFPWAKSLHHLSYGMVELPEGKMKSREGTVVDADDLIREMVDTAREMSKELGKLDALEEEEREDICRMIGLGALKYYILKVDPVKNMTFNPRESIDFDGNTGSFIQYTYARIRSVFRKGDELGIRKPEVVNEEVMLNVKEKNLLKLIHEFPAVISDAADTYNPSLIANFTFELVKEYNQFYHDHSILKEEGTDIRSLRLILSHAVAVVIRNGMGLLGIEMPERM